MKKAPSHFNIKGFAIVELLVAATVMLVCTLAIGYVTTGSWKYSQHASNAEKASALAEEAIESVRSLRDYDFAALSAGTYGLATSSGQVVLSGPYDDRGIFRRTVVISDVDQYTKRADVTISWSDSLSATNTVAVSADLTYWRKVTPEAGITITKSVINHGGSKVATDFTPFMVGTTTVDLGVATTVSPGTYSVTEASDPTYTTTFGTDCGPTGTIVLNDGDAKICSIVNEQKVASITVNKTVINHGGTKAVADFAPYKVGGTTVTVGVATNFTPGTYSVTETSTFGYTVTYGGDCSPAGQVTVALGESKTCTITNEESVPLYAYLTVSKTVINKGQSKTAADFAPYKVGTTTVSVGTQYSFGAGTYTVTETPLSDYAATFGGDCNGSGQVTLSLGVSKSCTITNTELLTSLGMVAYASGAGTTDGISYSTWNTNNSWSTAASAADVDVTTTNKAARALRIYSLSSRNEKVLISRHYDGTKQYIYAQVYNGSTGTWGNVIQLANFASTANLQVRNFDGTYTTNGTFMAVYSDNTIIPKMITWNGSAWSATSSLTTLGTGNIPNYIVLRARPGTNEAMAVFLTQGDDAVTEYWSGAAWSAITIHSTKASGLTNENIAFVWNRNSPLTGLVAYLNSAGAKSLTYKLWTANGTGGGSWSGAKNGNAIANPVSRLIATDRPGVNEFHMCLADNTANPTLNCEKGVFSGTTLTLTKPTNSIIGAIDTGTQLSYDADFQTVSGTPGVTFYSDTTTAPKYKKYNATTATYDVAASSISALLGVLKTVKSYPATSTNDMMVVMGDASNDLYTIMWDGTSQAPYSTPTGKALLLRGTAVGPATDAYWYDFTWN